MSEAEMRARMRANKRGVAVLIAAHFNTHPEKVPAELLDAIAAQLAAPVAAQEPDDAEIEAFAAWWGEPDSRSAMVEYWAQQAWLARAQLAAPVAAQEPAPTDRYVDSCHRAVERLTAALHVATLRAHPHMTHADIQAEIVRIARTPAPAAGELKAPPVSYCSAIGECICLADIGEIQDGCISWVEVTPVAAIDGAQGERQP